MSSVGDELGGIVALWQRDRELRFSSFFAERPKGAFFDVNTIGYMSKKRGFAASSHALLE